MHAVRVAVRDQNVSSRGWYPHRALVPIGDPPPSWSDVASTPARCVPRALSDVADTDQVLSPDRGADDSQDNEHDDEADDDPDPTRPSGLVGHGRDPARARPTRPTATGRADNPRLVVATTDTGFEHTDAVANDRHRVFKLFQPTVQRSRRLVATAGSRSNWRSRRDEPSQQH